MEQDTATSKQTSLKEVLSKLRESDGIFEISQQKLNYLANNTPAEGESKSIEGSEQPTLDSLNELANSLRRKANNIASYTNAIVGN